MPKFQVTAKSADLSQGDAPIIEAETEGEAVDIYMSSDTGFTIFSVVPVEEDIFPQVPSEGAYEVDDGFEESSVEVEETEEEDV